MMRMCWVVSVVLLVFGVAMQPSNGCFENERIGLLHIKSNFLSIGNTYHLQSWVEDRGSNCCHWERVTCSNFSTGHVTHLDLSLLLPWVFNNGNGMVNVSLFRPFEELLSLDLSDNMIEGWSNNEGFPRLKKLEILHLSNNALTSNILPSLSGLAMLRELYLGDNNYINDSAQGFPKLKKLETLVISGNGLKMNSSILSYLEGLSSLKILYLSDNSMNGPLPSEGFPKLKKLETLDISYNGLTMNSSIISYLEELSSLKTLYLSGNSIDDPLPSEGFSRLKKLETLDLSYNKLNGSIFEKLNGLTSLKKLTLESNKIVSLSPKDFVNFTELELLNLQFNSLGGSLNALRNLINLTVLDLSNNQLNSSVEALHNLTKLTVLDLSNNQLNNNSIEGLCEMKNLLELDLSTNMFNGQLPECLSMLVNLEVLDLTNNSFNAISLSFIRNLTSLVYLSLFESNLEGSFSLSILANHSKLKDLYISSKSPKAQVDTEETKWVPTFQLKSLILQSCNLNMNTENTIPSFLQYQSDLRYIDLSHNKLRGAFPSWLIQNNSMLESFYLMNNSLEGNLQLYSINQGMRYLDVSNNKISGSLPKEFGAFLPYLWVLNLSTNNFEGGIPASIGQMEELGFLDLSQNQLSGMLPEELATGCVELGTLKLSNNFLYGNVPTSFKSGGLDKLYLNNNNFNGTLHEVFGNNAGLVVLDISNNSISGAIPSSIGKFVYMEVLVMAENKLEGEIPFEFSNLSKLVTLDISQNKLSGSIAYFNLSSMKYLYLQKNALSGPIPLTFAESSKLVILDLRDNNLFGNIPSWIDKLPKLRVILLGGNKFHGQIPIELCKLKYVTLLDLSRNMIHGTIPSCLVNLSFGMEHGNDDDDDDGHNFQFGFSSSTNEFAFINASISIFNPPIEIQCQTTVAAEFRTKYYYHSYKGNILVNMTGLDLSCNELRGNIPYQIGNLQQIHALNLSHNHLSGSIPKSFSNLKLVESLDLSFNYLSGQIPFELTQLNFLGTFNVSYNNLSGIPPSAGQFANFDEDNYKGNPGLCGPLLKHKCHLVSPPSESNDAEEDEAIMDMVAFYWSFTGSYITILLGFIMVLYINVYWRMTWFYFIGKIIHKCFPSFPLY